MLHSDRSRILCRRNLAAMNPRPAAQQLNERARTLYWRAWLAKHRAGLIGARARARGAVLGRWLLRVAAVLAALWALLIGVEQLGWISIGATHAGLVALAWTAGAALFAYVAVILGVLALRALAWLARALVVVAVVGVVLIILGMITNH